MTKHPHLPTREPAEVPGLKIRAARPEDAKSILGLIRELAEFEKLLHEVVATEDLLRRSLFGENRSAEALIAEFAGPSGGPSDGKVAGFAIFFHNYSTFLAQPGLYLEDLYVTPGLRGKGVGQAILTYLAQTAVARGCGRTEWAVLDWNENAIRFYKRFGANPLSDWHVFRLTGDALRQRGTAP